MGTDGLKVCKFTLRPCITQLITLHITGHSTEPLIILTTGP